MPDGQPVHGASEVNDDFEVGYDLMFERRWERIELAGRCLAALVVALGLSGLLGRGPLSHRRAGTPGGAMVADFEPVTRWDTPAVVTLHLQRPGTPLTGCCCARCG